MIGDSRVESDLVLGITSHKCRALMETDPESYFSGSVEEWAKLQFEKEYALLFLGASGIAVRAIASSVKNKLCDSPVLVMDDRGQFVIPLLAGHVGGANELAEQLSSLTGAVPVITTATDNHQIFAADVWAKKQGLEIVNKEGIAVVSSKALEGGTLYMVVQEPDCWKYCQVKAGDLDVEFVRKLEPGEEVACDIFVGADWSGFGTVSPPCSATLWLRPKEYILGVGCKKGKSEVEIREVLQEALEKAGITFSQVTEITSIDVKKEEPGILAIAQKERVPFRTYTAEELNGVPGEFHESEFVRSQVGVGCVCERAAMVQGEKLVVSKLARDGVTVAIARRSWSST